MHILSLDVGTTSMRGILYDREGREVACETVLTPLLIDQKKNTMEQNPLVYRRGAVQICRGIAARYPVDAVSVTAFRSTPTLVDRQGEALCPFIMWQDTRNSAICESLRPHNQRIYQTCGASVNTVFTGTKLTWMKRFWPEAYQKAYKAMIVPDYIIHAMTGTFATDRTFGSRTLLMDIRTLQWNDDMCRLLEIDRNKLCELCDQGGIRGGVTPEFARATGLKAGIPVITAGGDQQCGALGLGVMDSQTIEVNSGTGSFVISLVDKPCLENSNVICNVAAVPGLYTQEMNIIASASAVNWLIREYFPEYWGDQPDFDAVNRIAAQTPAGAHGLLSVPHFQGCGSRDWNPQARAGFWGFSLGSKRGDMIRALYEGIAAEIAKSIDALPSQCQSAKEIAVAGGLSRSNIYLQILSGMTNRTLLRSHHMQATARGAWISAAVTLGLYGSYQAAIDQTRRIDTIDRIVPIGEEADFYTNHYKPQTEALYRAACAMQSRR